MSAFLHLNRTVQVAGKAALIPFGLGWTGNLVLFMPDSPTLDDFLDLDASAAVHIPWSVTLRLVDRILSRLPGTADFARELLRLARAGEPAEQSGDIWLGAAAYVAATLRPLD